VQLRTQTGSPLEALSTQDLTTLVASLNSQNDRLRTEIGTLQTQLDELSANQASGATSVGQIASDLGRIRAWAGLDPVSGRGVTLTVSGGIDGSAVEELINELRNAGAEAIAVADVRVVTGVVVTGAAGGAQIDAKGLGSGFEIDAIGAPDKLTGSLTRSGGVIAQLAATQPDVVLTVTPVDRLELPATTRNLVPAHGRPRL
jgi:uncharacterized protein YlxW (UPF0749 family)